MMNTDNERAALFAKAVELLDATEHNGEWYFFCGRGFGAATYRATVDALLAFGWWIDRGDDTEEALKRLTRRVQKL